MEVAAAEMKVAAAEMKAAATNFFLLLHPLYN